MQPLQMKIKRIPFTYLSMVAVFWQLFSEKTLNPEVGSPQSLLHLPSDLFFLHLEVNICSGRNFLASATIFRMTCKYERMIISASGLSLILHASLDVRLYLFIFDGLIFEKFVAYSVFNRRAKYAGKFNLFISNNVLCGAVW